MAHGWDAARDPPTYTHTTGTTANELARPLLLVPSGLVGGGVLAFRAARPQDGNPTIPATITTTDALPLRSPRRNIRPPHPLTDIGKRTGRAQGLRMSFIRWGSNHSCWPGSTTGCRNNLRRLTQLASCYFATGEPLRTSDGIPETRDHNIH